MNIFIKCLIFKMENKKGVSPLIAWVLLIGLSVSMGFLVMNWTKNTIPEPEPDLSFCDDVSLFLINYSVHEPNDNEVKFNITNNGLFTIKKWSFGVTNSTNIEGSFWCEISSNFELTPSENKLLFFEMEDYTDNPLCNEGNPFSITERVLPEEIVLIPWVTPIEGEDRINCNDKKITINL